MAYAIGFFVALCFWLLLPDKAFAWGPGTHLQIGIETLKHIGILGHSLRMLLESFPYDYLYGCIGADIIFAKGLARIHDHSHNWLVGFSVLEEADSPQQESFAYGYLSHLAADTIAHNYFIPECVVRTYPAKTLRHAYWEVRFDTLAKRELWTLAREIVRLPQHEEDDQLLERVVKRTLFSFKTDKKIFSSLLVLNRMEQWQKMLENLSEKSIWALSDRDAAKYRDLSSKSALDFLVHLERAACLKMDPTGKDALVSAKWIRRNLRELDRKGKLEPNLYVQALKALQPEGDAPDLLPPNPPVGQILRTSSSEPGVRRVPGGPARSSIEEAIPTPSRPRRSA
jgi:hypothetical protein